MFEYQRIDLSKIMIIIIIIIIIIIAMEMRSDRYIGAI